MARATAWPLFCALLCLSQVQAQEPAPGPAPAVAEELPAVEATATDANAAQETFDVMEYRVLGNSTLDAREVERAVYPYLGNAKTFADVEAARGNLELAYRQAGFGTVFVDLPEQNVDDGIVRLRVTEGRIDRVRISGTKYYSNRQIRAALPALASGSVPKIPEVQSEINAFNRRSADRSVVPVLKAGRTPGTVDISLQVADQHPWHGSVEVNDRYTAQTTKWRTSLLLSYDNLWQREHSLSFQYQTAPQDREDVEAMVASYAMPLRRWDNTTLVFYGVDSATDVAALGNINVLGNGRIYGARLLHGLPARADFSSNLLFGLDYKDFLEDIRMVDDTTLVTPIEYLNWSFGYSGSKSAENVITSFGATANFGVRGAVNETVEFEDKRFKGSPNYFYVRGNLQQLWYLPARFMIAGRVGAQYSATPLVSNEQIAIGGADTVRGYLESTNLGDYGFNGGLELRHDALARWLDMPRGAAYVSLFYDAGVVAIQEPLPGQSRRFDLASYGASLRIAGWYGLDLDLAWAHALTPSGDTLAGDERFHFLMRYGF